MQNKHTAAVKVFCVQANLKEALLSRYVEYRRSYLAALVAAMTPGAGPPPAPRADAGREAELQQSLELLLGDLEAQRGGPELLVQEMSWLKSFFEGNEQIMFPKLRNTCVK